MILMQISILILIIFASQFQCSHVSSSPDPLKRFLDTLAESQSDLLWIEHAVKDLHETKGQIMKRDLLHFRSIEEQDFMSYDESATEEDEDQEPLMSFIDTGDQWYEKFRGKECEASKKKEYCHVKNSGQKKFDTFQETSHFEKIFEPKPLPRIPNPAIPVNDDEYDDNDDFYKYHKEAFNKRQNDDLMTLYRNTLIEEANSEKLSKNEQDLASLSLPRHVQHSPSSSDRIQDKRRSVNPSNEIKLKISNKMMQKGLGPSLPSFGYNDESILVYQHPNKDQSQNSRSEKNDDSFVFPYKEHELPNYNLFKRQEMETQARTSDIDESDLQKESNERDQEWGEYDEKGDELEQPSDQVFGSRHLLSISKEDGMYDSDHHHHKRPEHSKYPKNIEQEFDYEKLAKEIHVFGPQIKDAHIEYGTKKGKGHVGVVPNESNDRRSPEMDQLRRKCPFDTYRPETGHESNSHRLDEDLSDPEGTKASPSHQNNPFGDLPKRTENSSKVIQVSSGNNGTHPMVNVKVELNSNNLTEMGNITLARIEIGTSKSKRFVSERLRRGRDEALTTTNAIRHLIENIYKSMDDDPDLKNWISPHLMSRYDALYGESEVGSHENSKEDKTNESQIRERNLNELSNKIERLIQNEVQTRICAQLPPEMDAYYRKLTKENEETGRSQREDGYVWNENGRRVRSIGLDQISSKYETVQNLLRQYHNLPLNEQSQLTSIKEMLDKHIRFLDELKDAMHENTKENQRNETIAGQKLSKRISDRFERLSKAVTFIRKSNKS